MSPQGKRERGVYFDGLLALRRARWSPWRRCGPAPTDDLSQPLRAVIYILPLSGGNDRIGDATRARSTSGNWLSGGALAMGE